MLIEEKYWNPKLDLLEMPKFFCPHCNIGRVQVEKGKLIHEQTTNSEKACYELGPEFEKGIFTWLGRCSDPVCKEIITVSGTYETTDGTIEEISPNMDDHVYEQMEEMGIGPGLIQIPKYKITYVSSPIKLIQLPNDLPKDLEQVIKNSFYLFWVDTNAAANKIRSFIELLLDQEHWNVKEFDKNDRRMDLGVRLNDHLPKDFTIYGKKLSALKWIGNDGSHYSKYKLTRSDLKVAYEILEICLDDLYTEPIRREKKKRIEDLANDININKGIKNIKED